MYRTDLIIGSTKGLIDSIRHAAKDADCDGARVALKCPDAVFCARGKQDFANYKKTSREGCPKCCALY